MVATKIKKETVEKRSLTANARAKSFVQSMANRLGYEIRRLPATGERPEEPAAELKPQQTANANRQYRRSNGQLLTPEIVRSLVESHKGWAHTVTLPFGIKTPGRYYVEDLENWTAQVIPMELTGLSVLDVGACDGYYSFLREKRGAKVTAIDSLMHRWGTRGFDICKDILDSKVSFTKLDVYDVESLKQRFDIVLYLGVYYPSPESTSSLRKALQRD